MDRTRNAVQRMLAALDAPAYDLGILSERGNAPRSLESARRESSLPAPAPQGPQCARGAHLYPASGRAPLHRPRRP